MSHSYVPPSTVCPVCMTQYGDLRPGARCRDMSQGQERPCVGFVIEKTDIIEWRRAPVPSLKSTPKVLERGEVRYDVTRDGLVLTVSPDRVEICDDCPDMHVLILPVATHENVRKLAAGIAHLAEHCTPEKSAS